MTIKRKIARLRAIKAEAQKLEREILEEGFKRLQKPGQTLLMKPRLERIMEQFA